MDNTTSVLHEVKEFCNETSIHGLGQIANDRAWVIKRLLWFGVVVACFTYAGYQLSFKIEGIYVHCTIQRKILQHPDNVLLVKDLLKIQTISNKLYLHSMDRGTNNGNFGIYFLFSW